MRKSLYKVKYNFRRTLYEVVEKAEADTLGVFKDRNDAINAAYSYADMFIGAVHSVYSDSNVKFVSDTNEAVNVLIEEIHVSEDVYCELFSD